MRRTKIICTIGPKTSSYDALQKLADAGMDIARLNLSHGDHAWHEDIIRKIRSINAKGQHSIAILLDTKGAEVRSGDLKHKISLERGDKFILTIRKELDLGEYCTEISSDSFFDTVKKNDQILIDGGLMSMIVKEKTDKDLICEVRHGGILTSRRHLSIKGKSAKLPTITKKDWEDIRFALKQKVDFIALSFVKDPMEVVKLKVYLAKYRVPIDVIAKIESVSALPKVNKIIQVSDGVMIARGDLGAEVPLEEIPLIQASIIEKCRDRGVPVIVATHLLESMISYPTPTRAEVADIAVAVQEMSDCIMLSGETAAGKYPYEAVRMMDQVAKRIEKQLLERRSIGLEISNDPKKEIARSAVILSNNLEASAILVFTRRGFTATLVSRCRPNSRVFAFSNTPSARRRLNLYWGIAPYRIEFSQDPETTVERAIALLLSKKLIRKKELVIVVSDMLAGKEFVETIQVREIK